MKYSVVIPCYKSSKTVGKVVELLQDEFKNSDLEIVLVNDGSPDNGTTAEAILELSNKFGNVIAVDLAKNVGQHNAIMCALRQASGDYIICMDDDLQTHPNQINKLIDTINDGYDVVYACYPEKKHAWYRNLGSKFSSWTVRILIGKPKNLKTSSFWICKKFVRDYMIQYKNSNTFIPGLVLRVTRNVANVEVEHYNREVGKSGYTLKKLIKLWSNIIGFSVKPLRIAGVIGALSSFLGLVGTIVVIVKKLFWGVNATGWSSVIVAIMFFAGVILLFMGLIGEYIGRMYIASGNEPQYVIRTISRKEKEDDRY